MTARLALRLAAGAALLALLWQVADGPAAVRRILAAGPLWLLAALLALHAQIWLSALRWRVTARGLGFDLPAGRAVREYYVAQLVNQTLPGGVAGDAARAVRMRGEAGFGPSLAAVAVERLAGQIAMAGALATGLAASLVWPAGLAWPPGLRPAALATLGALAVAGVWLWRSRKGRIADALRGGLAVPGAGRTHLVLGLTILALNLLAFACAARATGTALSPVAVLSLVPLILTAMLVPLSIGGWGWREGAAALLFPIAGAAPEAGLAAAATFGVLILISALPGAIWLIPRRTGLPSAPHPLP